MLKELRKRNQYTFQPLIPIQTHAHSTHSRLFLFIFCSSRGLPSAACLSSVTLDPRRRSLRQALEGCHRLPRKSLTPGLSSSASAHRLPELRECSLQNRWAASRLEPVSLAAPSPWRGAGLGRETLLGRRNRPPSRSPGCTSRVSTGSDA